jgi:tetratricopeptide (TPR) repeat protein
MSGPALYLNHDADYDWLIALPFGLVNDGQPEDHWRGVSEAFGYLLDRPGGCEIGFVVQDYSEFDAEDPEISEIWHGPPFAAPAVGLRDATAGEIVVAASVFLDGESTINRHFFDQAARTTGTVAEEWWRYCLQAGDCMAHYGLGYTLYELGRYRQAYRHLRAYAELVPANSWAWCWLGRACGALGETAEARLAYERAIALEERGADETDAAELLSTMLPDGEAA